MQQVKPGIFIENSYLGVTLGALIYPHGTIYIDSPLRPEDARAWRSNLMSQRGGPNRMLISLDSHIDRTLGARALDCTIVAHLKTANIYRNRPTIFKGQSLESGSDWETYIDSIGTRWALPDITFTHSLFLHWGGPEILVEHHPGPASGASWVIIPEEKVVFIGDAVLPDQPPFLANADLEPWIEALNLLLAKYRNYIIISGRGGIIPIELVRTQQRSLKKLIKGLDKLAQKSEPPEVTEKLIPIVLASVEFPAIHQEQYISRLRTGLYQYYLRHFRPANPFDTSQISEEEV
jgi:glyoxylase-like metal-dependent hydrolase (beta-lactamase superfamily II)